MASRVKEDEKNERIIRGLLKLTENRRCINCNNLGPQYVCTTFWTFVCTPCSGIHREFTHRVKSVSMAKFASQEVKALQEGGNQRTKEIYLKEWDPQRNSFPDSSNVERLRDFIKHVYVDRRYTGERNSDKPPRSKTGEKEDSYENKRAPSYQGGSRSPPFEDSEQRYSGRSSPGARSYDGGRSPGYDQDSRQTNDYRKSPARPEVVNDWRREDRFGNGSKNDDRRMSDGDSKMEGRSPDRPKNVGSASPPVVRPVREILGENTIPLRVIEPPPPKPAARAADGSAHTQRSASSSSLASANGNPVEVKSEPSGSLIDFDADAKAPVAAPPQQSSTVQPTSQPANSATDNWASFDMSPQVKAPEAAPNLSMDSLLSQLSVSAPVPAHNYGVPGGNAMPAVSVNNLSTFPLDGMSVVAPGSASVFPVNTGNTAVNALGAAQWPNSQQQQQHSSFFSAAGNQPSSQQFTQPPMGGTSNTKPWNAVPAPNAHGFPSNLTQMVHPSAVRPVHEVHSSVASQSPVTDVKPSGRTALPEDLFASSYSNFRAPVPGWQTGPPGGMGGYGMPYNMGMSGQAYQQPFQPAQGFQQQPFQPVQAFQQQTFQPVQAFQQPSKSTNPFDLTSEAPAQAPPTFPSMGSLESALPNAMNPSGLMRTGSLGTPSSPWMAQPQPQRPSSSFSSLLPPQAPPAYPSALPTRAYMGQQVPNNILPPGHQQGENSGFSSFTMEQQLHGRFSAPATPSPFSSSGGNPFG